MRSPDLTAPRFRYKYKETITKDVIARFKKKYPQYESYSDESLMKAIKIHNDSIWKEVINNRDGVQLQGGTGIIFIAMTPPRKKEPPVAWKKSIELGMKVYHKNYETDGKLVKIYYSNYSTRCRFTFRQLWYFNAVRQFTRAASAECPKDWRKYHVSDAKIRVWELLNDRVTRATLQKRTKRQLVTYNDFDLD